MQGIGIDIEEIVRFQTLPHFRRFLEFVFSPSEIALAYTAPDVIRFVASRFAVKEAVIKALPVAATYHDMEIIKVGNKPEIRWQNQSLQSFRVHISLSHSQTAVVGAAMIE